MNRLIYTLKEIEQKISPIAQKYDVPTMYIFGSYARGEATDKSDVDLLFQRKGSTVRGWVIGAFYEDLHKSLGKNLDLVTIETLEQETTKSRTPWFVNNLLKERRLIYAKQ